MEIKLSSESIANIADSLSKAQSKIGNAVKDTKNPFYKTMYADLNAVWSACQAALTENGLSFTCSTVSEGTTHTLIATLMHSSGEWLRTFVPLILAKQDMQGLIAATTYARRCALASLCNVASSDDDGESNRIKHEDQLNLIESMIIEIDEEGLVEKICSHIGIDSIKDLPVEKMDSIAAQLRKKIDAKKGNR